jgi:hypothetical protein
VVREARQAKGLVSALHSHPNRVRSLIETIEALGLPPDTITVVGEEGGEAIRQYLQGKTSGQQVGAALSSAAVPLSSTTQRLLMAKPERAIYVGLAPPRASKQWPAIEVRTLDEFLADTLITKQAGDQVEFRIGRGRLESAPLAGLAAAQLARLAAGRRVLMGRSVSPDLASKLFEAKVIAFLSFDAFIRDPWLPSRLVKPIFIEPSLRLAGQNVLSVERALAKARTIPDSVIVASRQELMEAVRAARAEDKEPLPVFHNDPRGIALQEGSIGLLELSKLGVKAALSCNTYEALSELEFGITGELDLEAMVDALAWAADKYGNAAPPLDTLLREGEVPARYNRIREEKGMRGRLIFGGVLAGAAAPIIVVGAIVVKSR